MHIFDWPTRFSSLSISSLSRTGTEELFEIYNNNNNNNNNWHWCCVLMDVCGWKLSKNPFNICWLGLIEHSSCPKDICFVGWVVKSYMLPRTKSKIIVYFWHGQYHWLMTGTQIGYAYSGGRKFLQFCLRYFCLTWFIFIIRDQN